MGKTSDRPSAFEQALRFLDRKALSEKELTAKLQKCEYPQKEIAEAVARCRERKFINDQLMISDCMESLFARGNGSRLIKLKLLRRGLDSESISATLVGTESQEEESCRLAAYGKMRSLVRESDPRKKREKLFRFLASRGFSATLAGKIIDELKKAPDSQ